MTKKPFIAHSEITNEIYIVCGTEKYLVTEQVIKAMQNTGRLEQPTSDDCVSRQAVIDTVENTIAKYIPTFIGQYEKIPLELARAIKDVPPVIPTSKTGKWTGEEEGYYSECSCCGASFLWEDYKYLGDWKYCPKCGAKLVRCENGR